MSHPKKSTWDKETGFPVVRKRNDVTAELLLQIYRDAGIQLDLNGCYCPMKERLGFLEPCELCQVREIEDRRSNHE